MRSKTIIDRRYNPEYDMIPDGPAVTWAEYDLQQQVHRLEEQVDLLEERIAALEGGGRFAPIPGYQAL